MIERINILATTKILVLNHHYMISTRTKDSATKLVPDTNLVHEYMSKVPHEPSCEYSCDVPCEYLVPM